MKTTNHEAHAHDALRDDLKAYLDNELTVWRRVAVRRHLSTCAQCRTEIKDMETITNKLAAESGEETALDATLRSRILSSAPEAAERTFETAPTAPARRLRPSAKDFVLVGGLTSLLVFATLNTLGKKVQTVFNVANNALTTGGGSYESPSYSASAPQAGAPASSPVFKSEPEGFARKEETLDTVTRRDLKSSVSAADALDIQRRVHKEASIGVAVSSAETASDAVVALVQGAGGFIAGNSLTSAADNSKNASIEVRVPVGKFESVLAQIGKLGEVKSKNISGQDMTERFSDADQARRILINDLSLKEAQLRNAKERAERKKKTYVPGWQERAELRNLRIGAAQARARLELLRKTTDLSNISVQLQENATPPGQAGFWQSLNSTKIDAARSFVEAARIPIACLIWILAYSPLWLPLLFAWRYFNRAPKNTA